MLNCIQDLDDDDDYDVEDSIVQPDADSSYNLRNQRRVRHSAIAHVDIVGDVEQPKLGVALKSDDWPKWINAIRE